MRVCSQTILCPLVSVFSEQQRVHGTLSLEHIFLLVLGTGSAVASSTSGSDQKPDVKPGTVRYTFYLV